MFLAILGFISVKQIQGNAIIAARISADMLSKQLSDKLSRELSPAQYLFPLSRISNVFTIPSDPILSFRSKFPESSLVLVGPTGELRYPSPGSGLPLPKPPHLETLSPIQKDLWNRVTANDFSKFSPRANTSDITSTLEQLPSRLRALAFLRWAQSLLAQDRKSRTAASLLERVLRDWPKEVSTTGLPLSYLVQRIQLQYFRVSEGSQRHLSELVNQLCQQLTVIGGWLARLELNELDSMIHALTRHQDSQLETAVIFSRIDRAKKTVACHDEIRGMNRRLRERDGTLGLREEVASSLGHRWRIQWSSNDLISSWTKVLSQLELPNFVSAHLITWDGNPSQSANAPLLADTRVTEAGLLPPYKVEIRLADTKALYKVHHQRILFLVVTTGLSTIGVFFGVLAIYFMLEHQRRLNRLKSNLISGISHELRTPIASIGLMSEEILAKAERNKESVPREASEYLRLIGEECHRAGKLIDDVLNFSRQESGNYVYQFEAVDLVSMLGELVLQMRPTAQIKALELNSACSRRQLIARVDQAALRQAILNLIDNAIKHSPTAGSVTVHLSEENADSDPSHLKIVVSDQGTGIPPEEKKSVTEPFYRLGNETTRRTKGVGLGLAVVKMVAEGHRGTIEITGRPGESRIGIRIPWRR